MMAADSSNDLELTLKKRARRRLVGAIALVLLMVIVLPMVLQDRAATAPQEAIKITMPDDAVNQPVAPVVLNEVVPAEPPIASEPAVTESEKSDFSEVSAADESSQMDGSSAVKDSDKKSVRKPEVKVAETEKVKTKSNESKSSETEVNDSVAKKVEVKVPTSNTESFTIQVGVYSEMANVKQLQARLKDAGFDSHTENISTAKGEKIRLKAGHFGSRQEAAYALTKLQAADLTGMVISNN
jgi:DedD protein